MATLLKSFETSGDADEPIGDLGGDEFDFAQSFTLDTTAVVSRVDLFLKKVNTITDAITVTIETSAAGPKPSGTLADANATQTVTLSNTSYDWVTITFPGTFSLTGGTKYWVKAVVGNQSLNNHYDWFKDSGDGYPGHGESSSVNGAAFSNEGATGDLYFRVYAPDGQENTGYVYFM